MHTEGSITTRRLAFGLREAAATLGVSQAFLRIEVRRGRLRPVRLGRRVLVSTAELQRYLEQGMQGEQ